MRNLHGPRSVTKATRLGIDQLWIPRTGNALRFALHVDRVFLHDPVLVGVQLFLLNIGHVPCLRRIGVNAPWKRAYIHFSSQPMHTCTTRCSWIFLRWDCPGQVWTFYHPSARLGPNQWLSGACWHVFKLDQSYTGTPWQLSPWWILVQVGFWWHWNRYEQSDTEEAQGNLKRTYTIDWTELIDLVQLLLQCNESEQRNL